ncbi:MAG: hypothetical protein KF902_06360 [Phycisphaeraceae bacterium]|nr:hypothetical protein [Phycisphaeraceae bacterium]QYK48992.1 MAG: hypothetical protein KF838_03865 [Phycisphaeraceae bacterium]
MIATSDQHPDPRVVAECIPAELKTMPRWACWKAVSNREGGKPKKIPIDPHTGGAAKSTDPATWGTFDEAIASLARDPSLSGVMFALGEDIGIVGVDLDGCIDADGVMTPEARVLVEEFDTYAERSPSGSGVKMLCYGKKPGKRCRKKDVHGCHEIEVYSKKRFFVITGLRLDDVSPVINERQVELDDLYATMFPPKPEPPPTNSGGGFSGDDNALLQRARDAANGGKFTRLYDAGDISEYGGDDSAADLALVSMLAFWAGPDPDRIDRLFRGSALMREKWDREDYRERTISTALDGMTEFFGQSPPRVSASGTPLPEVELGPDEYRVIDQVVESLAADQEVYQRGGVLVRVVHVTEGKSSRSVIVPLEPPTLREVITRNVVLLKFDKKAQDFVPAHPPGWLVTGVHARGTWPGIRTLAAIASAPVLRADGSVVQMPGYDAQTQVLYEPNVGFPVIPDEANLDDASAAMERLLDLVRDFPFASDAHRAAWLAGLLTLVARHAFIGNAPIFLIDANIRGAGKTLLVQVAGWIALGHDVPVSTYSHDPVEMRKALTTMVMAAEPMVLLDNLAGVFGNDAIDRAATSPRWRDRILGGNTQVNLPMTTVIWATGNNITLQADTTRRVIHIRLDSPLERPEDRANFVHRDLLAYVAKHRQSLYVDVVTILAAFVRAGCPLPEDLRALGSFENWSRVVRGAVIWVGLPDPCSTRDGLEVAADAEKEILTDLLDAMERYDPLGNGVVLATLMADLYPALGSPPADAASVAMRTAIETATNCPAGKPPAARQVGSRFKRLRDRVVGGRKLTSRPGEKRAGGVVWRVVKQDQTGEGVTQ